MKRGHFQLVGAVLVACWLLPGCGKAELTELVDQAKKKAAEGGEMVKQSVVESVDATVDRAAERLGQGKEAFHSAGEMKLIAGEPVAAQACYARLIVIGGGRPNVLQLASYREAGQETYPAIFAQGHVLANSLEELAGQTLAAEWYLQREASGPVLFTDAGAQIELNVTSASGQAATIEIVAGQLRDSQSGQEVALTGTLRAVVP